MGQRRGLTTIAAAARNRYAARLIVGANALGSDLSLELGEGQKHVERQPAHRSRGVELLGDRDERHAVRIEQFYQLSKVGQRSRQAIDLVDDNNIKLPRTDTL